MAIQTKAAKLSSVALRISALIFFRLFPAHFPSIAFALFAIYVPSYIASYFAKPEIGVLKDEVTVKESTITSETPLLTEDGVAVAPKAKAVADIVDIEEKVIVGEKIPSIANILLSGAPNAKRPIASFLTLLVNAVLIGLTADALYRARWHYPSDDLSFVRLGFVSPSEAKFVIREPNQLQMPITFEYHIKDDEPTYDSKIWLTAGFVTSTDNSTDFTTTLTVPLDSAKQNIYEWRTSNNHTGEFRSAPKAGEMPSTTNRLFTFLSTSCILPRFPYNPMEHALAIPGLRNLAALLPKLDPQFMLFLGDFIYIDVPERFGKTAEEYRMQYRQVYASPDWTPVAQNLSWIHVLDDHEISNDWSSNTTGIYSAAVDPWHIYQANVNPPIAKAAGPLNSRRNATWYEFTQGPASFFMMDTRSYRSSNNAPFNATDKTMLGQEQLADLLAWLERPMPQGVRWKFIASSVPFTKNWPINVKDTWGGFLAERKKILEAMWDSGARGTSVVILSGDRHEFAATRFPPPVDSRWPQSAAAHEFSTSPLNQFASPFPTYRQTDDEDVMMNYIPGGKSKFGSFSIEKLENSGSSLYYTLYVDGRETWKTTVEAPDAPEAVPAHRPDPPLQWPENFPGKILKSLTTTSETAAIFSGSVVHLSFINTTQSIAMAGPGNKKKRQHDGRLQRPSKKQKRKQLREYNSDSEPEEAQEFDAVNLLDSDDDIHNVKVDDVGDSDNEVSSSEDEGAALKKPLKKPKSNKPEAESDEEEEDDDDEGSEDYEDDEDGDSTNTRKKSKRNDPNAFATSLSKILSTKLSSSKRSDPVLARSAAAHEASKAAIDSALESKARKQMREQRKRAFEKGRVKDVLIASTNDATGELETSTSEIMETERRLRKVAQRGVVKLFNAVRAAQVKAVEAEKGVRKEGLIGMKKREEKVNEMSKKGFLELIASGGGGLKKGALEEA
ncbi:alkaline phosphatase D [Fusarium beomiforme]|uniref:Alkaline phosphatase D n=1 Tax=Fusarium beomiforme TaxID=44412 RepID=A0A9P5AUY7_9HYPO|nr:alkaline phosphatase D [Fusarium beomiforme]